MNKIQIVGCAASLLAAGSLLAAEPKDDVVMAARALANTGNFSWTQRVLLTGFGGDGAAAAAPTVIDTMGMTDKGFIFTSNNLNGVSRETVVKGTNGAVKAVPFGGGDAVWRTWEEMAAATAAAMGANGGGGRGPGVGRPGAGGRLGIGRYGEDRFALPTDQVADILSNVVSMTMAGNTYTGDLTGAEATNRLTATRRGGRGGGGGLGGGGGRFVPAFNTDAKGIVTFTLKNGMLAGCVVKVTGKRPAPQGADATDYGSETTIEFSNVGGTKLPVPDDILTKISK